MLRYRNCYAVALLVQYFFLVHLQWLILRIVMARDALMLRPMPSMLERMLWGWAFPGLVVGLVALTDSLASGSESHIGLSPVDGCWVLSYQLWAILLPAIIIIFVVGCWFTYRLVVEIQASRYCALHMITGLCNLFD